MHLGIGTGLVGLAVAVFWIGRQVLPRRVSWPMLALTPLALVYFALRMLPAGPVAARSLTDLGGELALGIACGLWQARRTAVFPSAGRWYIQGGAPYLAAWAACLAGDVVLALLLEGPAGMAAATWVLLLGGAATWGARTVGLLALHPELLQPAPEAARAVR